VQDWSLYQHGGTGNRLSSAPSLGLDHPSNAEKLNRIKSQQQVPPKLAQTKKSRLAFARRKLNSATLADRPRRQVLRALLAENQLLMTEEQDKDQEAMEGRTAPNLQPHHIQQAHHPVSGFTATPTNGAWPGEPSYKMVEEQIQKTNSNSKVAEALEVRRDPEEKEGAGPIEQDLSLLDLAKEPSRKSDKKEV